MEDGAVSGNGVQVEIRWVINPSDDLSLPNRDVVVRLFSAARRAREQAWVPISGYKVGAALLTISGQIFTGANVESSNGQSICAERTALVKAVSEGEIDFAAVLAIADSEASITPCGQCRQHLADFSPAALVFMATLKSSTVDVAVLADLFPRSDFRGGLLNP
jgi:cytidine deaminase